MSDDTDHSSNLSSTPPASNIGSPTSSFSSDKENSTSRKGKRRQENHTGSATNNRVSMNDASNKRRRLSGRDDGMDSQAVHKRALDVVNDKRFYDPDQDPEERRAVRKGLRDLTTQLNDSRNEYLQAGSSGLFETVTRANQLFESVKQTSDATIDSRLLVNAADLSYKRAAKAVLGDFSAGVDVEEFVSKCISFMRRGGGSNGSPSQPSGTQWRRRNTQGGANDSDEDRDADDLNWELLGRQACYPFNLRPSLSGFLYGPLAVQKRSRQQTQRRARQERIDPSQAIRPVQLQAEDLEKQETANLTAICTEILGILTDMQQKGDELVAAELSKILDVSPKQVKEVSHKYGLSSDGGVPLFNFCINPQSFGQTVENLFYVSFLVRDGSAGIHFDEDQLPTLQRAEPLAPSEAQKLGAQKHQAIFSLDFETWEELIKVFNIKKPVIPHRKDEEIERPAAMYV